MDCSPVYDCPVHITRRKLQPERMDDPGIDRESLGESLEALAKTNRRLGGTRAVLREFARWSRTWTPGETIRILDVGTGSADIPIAIVDWAREQSFDVEITAVDLHPSTIAFAQQRTADYPEIDVLKADARELTGRFAVDSFDYAHAGLFLHHLHDVDVMTVLRMMQRLARRGLIWNDLVRSPLTKIAIIPFSWFGPEVFRHDAVASMHAGFTKREALEIARRVGLENVRYRQMLFHRFILTSERSGSGA